jgi:hypothetical protein
MRSCDTVGICMSFALILAGGSCAWSDEPMIAEAKAKQRSLACMIVPGRRLGTKRAEPFTHVLTEANREVGWWVPSGSRKDPSTCRNTRSTCPEYLIQLSECPIQLSELLIRLFKFLLQL